MSPKLLFVRKRAFSSTLNFKNQNSFGSSFHKITDFKILDQITQFIFQSEMSYMLIPPVFNKIQIIRSLISTTRL